MVAARPTRTAPICSSARLVLRVMPGVGRRCVHCVIDVEAVPSTNNARCAGRCPGPGLKDGGAGLKDKLGELRHFRGGWYRKAVSPPPQQHRKHGRKPSMAATWACLLA